MKKKLMMALGLVQGLAAFDATAADILKLPEPQKDGGIPLMEAITRRKTTREFSAKKIDDQMLSDILYAAWGISHDGKRTIPTARNLQDMQVYVVKADGTFLYDGESNTLNPVSDKDLRSYFNKQEFMSDAPLTLLFTGKDPKYAPMHAGSAYQNVALYTAGCGLNNVVRGMFDKEGIAQELGIPAEEVLISQTIGWPYM